MTFLPGPTDRHDGGLAGLKGQIDPGQHVQRAEGLTQAAKFQKRPARGQIRPGGRQPDYNEKTRSSRYAPSMSEPDSIREIGHDPAQGRKFDFEVLRGACRFRGRNWNATSFATAARP